MKHCSPWIAAVLFLTLLGFRPDALGQETSEEGQSDRQSKGLLEEAKAAFDEQRFDEALEYAKKAEELDPEDSGILMLLGKIYLSQAVGIERYTGFAGYFRRDLLGEGEEYFRRVLKQDPDHALARDHLAFTLLLLKNIPAALDQAEEVLRRIPDDAYAHYLIGEIHLLQENAVEAEASFRAALRSDPSSAESKAGLIRALTEQGKRDEARDTLLRLIEEIPDLPGVLNLAYNIYEPFDLLTESASLYESILAAIPDRTDIRFQLGSVYYRLGRFEDTRRTIDAVLEKDPEHEGGLYYKGCLLVKDGFWTEARLFLERSARQEGDYYSYALDRMHLIALRLAEEGDFDGALATFDALLEINPSNTMALSNKALALSKAGRPDEAEAAYRELLDREPWDSSYVNNYALHLFGKGKTAEGLAMLEKAVEIDGNVDALENLGAYYYYADQNWDRAQDYLERVLTVEPDRTKSLIIMAFIKIKRESGGD